MRARIDGVESVAYTCCSAMQGEFSPDWPHLKTQNWQSSKWRPRVRCRKA